MHVKKNTTLIRPWEKRAAETDVEIRRAFEVVEARWLCIMAMGSYGRNEMSPYSDADLLLLIQDGRNKEDVLTTVIRSLHAAHPRTSIVVRTVPQCLSMVDTDIRSWLSLLESRYVAGDEELSYDLKKSLEKEIQERGDDYFVEKMKKYFSVRHAKYGDSARLLEPNIKNSGGALRDTLAVYYRAVLKQQSERASLIHTNSQTLSALLPFTELSADRQEAVAQCHVFLLSVREEMHLLVGHLHDMLEYDLQRNVAERLGFGSAEAKESVESFMAEYYRHSRGLRSAYELLFVRSGRLENMEIVLDETFFSSEGYLHIRQDAGFFGEYETMLSWFHICQHELIPGREVLESVDAFVSSKGATFSDRSFGLFDSLLRCKSNVGKTLRRMNDHGVLGVLFPEFGALRYFFQHNIYHYYTTDEHTLIAVERCEELRNKKTFLGTLFYTFPDSSLLYYSIIFHDIAKPLDVARHEIVGEGIAKQILTRVGRTDIVDEVAFAVRQHLLTEKTAFRRNIQDKATIAPYADVVGTIERLNLLHVLAYADLAALNPNVWTQWKGEILQELHKATSDMLLQASVHVEAVTSRPLPIPARAPIPSGIPLVMKDASVFPGEHTDVQALLLEDGVDYRIFFREGSTYSTITVIAHDAPYLLSRIAAVFLSCDAGIVDASVQTTDQGKAVDIFRVYDLITGTAIQAEKQEQIERTLAAVLAKETDTEELFRRHREKWKRKLRNVINPVTRIDVMYQQHVSDAGVPMTIIDVYAPDTLGLLYRLTDQISSFRLNILAAKIATRVDGVVDSFYVAEANGEPLTNPRIQKELRRALLHQIQRLTTISVA